ncbi:hypothetical protein [Streptomyces sp. URMC 123]|uniref:hypothetical protein n=1 Tax=Streptomyces sp. URMC 123 TaxID=3423403 RepID=UPI003F19B8F0
MSATLREVVREVVTRAAPQELPLLDGVESLPEERVTELFGARGRRGDTLGFGIAEATALVTPVVWMVVAEVVGRGVGPVLDGAFARARSRWARRFRRAPAVPVTVPPLSPAQLDAVHRQVQERAGGAGLDAAAAGALADTVVSCLARSAGREPERMPERTGDGAG